MRDRRFSVLAGAGMMWALGACAQLGIEGGTGDPAAAQDEDTELRSEEARPQLLLKDLGPTARRVKIIVLPGDAAVEIDGVPIRRRDGIIELTGKVGEAHRLRAVKGVQYLERDVTIQEAGASPPLLDLNERPARVAGPFVDRAAASAAPTAPTAPPRSSLLPEDFQ